MFLYDEKKLSEFITLKKDNKWIWRLVLFLVTVPVVSALKLWNFTDCFQYFTDWNMWLTFVHVLIVLSCLECEESKGLLAAAHATFELSLIMNMIVCCIYWPFLHGVTMIKFKGDFWKTLHMYHVHSFPMISLILLWYFNELRLCRGHWKVLIPLGPIYACWNYYCFL